MDPPVSIFLSLFSLSHNTSSRRFRCKHTKNTRGREKLVRGEFCIGPREVSRFLFRSASLVCSRTVCKEIDYCCVGCLCSELGTKLSIFSVCVARVAGVPHLDFFRSFLRGFDSAAKRQRTRDRTGSGDRREVCVYFGKDQPAATAG